MNLNFRVKVRDSQARKQNSEMTLKAYLDNIEAKTGKTSKTTLRTGGNFQRSRW